jgi:hypothetical protein
VTERVTQAISAQVQKQELLATTTIRAPSTTQFNRTAHALEHLPTAIMTEHVTQKIYAQVQKQELLATTTILAR